MTHRDSRCWERYPVQTWGRSLARTLRSLGLAGRYNYRADAALDSFLDPIVDDLVSIGVTPAAAEDWAMEIAAEAGACESEEDFAASWTH